MNKRKVSWLYEWYVEADNGAVSKYLTWHSTLGLCTLADNIPDNLSDTFSTVCLYIGFTNLTMNAQLVSSCTKSKQNRAFAYNNI